MLPSFGLVYSLYIATIATPVNKKKQKNQKKIRRGVALPPGKRTNNCSGLGPGQKKWQHGGNLPKTRAACWPVASAHFQPFEL
jgi:hypothetical protein